MDRILVYSGVLLAGCTYVFGLILRLIFPVRDVFS